VSVSRCRRLRAGRQYRLLLDAHAALTRGSERSRAGGMRRCQQTYLWSLLRRAAPSTASTASAGWTRRVNARPTTTGATARRALPARYPRVAGALPPAPLTVWQSCVFGACTDDGQCSHCTVYGFCGAGCADQCAGGALNPCGAHGTCDSNISSCACRCDYGYGGLDCAPCPGGTDTPCSLHGVCSEDASAPVCTCERGYWGVGCEGVCSGGAAFPCSGHGECRADDGRCDCLPTYDGDDCGSCTAGFYASATDGKLQCVGESLRDRRGARLR
jgi:hypothetical protein